MLYTVYSVLVISYTVYFVKENIHSRQNLYLRNYQINNFKFYRLQIIVNILPTFVPPDLWFGYYSNQMPYCVNCKSLLKVAINLLRSHYPDIQYKFR